MMHPIEPTVEERDEAVASDWFAWLILSAAVTIVCLSAFLLKRNGVWNGWIG